MRAGNVRYIYHTLAERNRHLGGRQTISTTSSQVDLTARNIHTHNGHSADLLLDELVWLRSVDCTCPIMLVFVLTSRESTFRDIPVQPPWCS